VSKETEVPDIKLSQELFAIPQGDDFIVYAPLQGVALLCNASLVNLLRRLYNGDVSVLADPTYAEVAGLLQETGLLINGEQIGKEADALKVEQSSSVFSPTRVTFLVTTNCNLRCVYCYASAGERNMTIPFEVCQAAIDLVVANAVDLDVPDCHIAFHGGGEPTTAFSLIRQCVDYAHETTGRYGKRSSFSLVTNGVLTHNQIKWLAANMTSISVSLDGPPDIQNRQRPLKDGQGSFDLVFSTVKSLERLGTRPFLRATITNESVGRMREISRFFCQNFDTQEFQLEPVAVCGRCVTTGYREPTVEEFVAGVEEATEEAAKFGKKAVCSAALETFPNLMEAYCGVTAPNFAITPEGIVTACYEVSESSDPRGEFFYYGYYDGTQRCFVFNEEVIQKLRGRVIQNIERCRDCFCRWQCAGDCPVRSVWRFPTSETSDETDFRCQVTRELLKRRLAQTLREQSKVSSTPVKLYKGGEANVHTC